MSLLDNLQDLFSITVIKIGFLDAHGIIHQQFSINDFCRVHVNRETDDPETTEETSDITKTVDNRILRGFGNE